MTEGSNKFTCPFCKQEHHSFTSQCPVKKQEIPVVYRLHGWTLDGKYVVEGVIGEGGMGIIYEGKQISIGKKVAIKFLFPEIITSKETISRFHNEARLAASIAHKNIIEIFDMGTIKEKIPYIVMEYLEGNSLDEIIKLGPLPEPMVSSIAIEILSALNAVHSRGIIHRDLKPENVFIMEQSGGEQIVKILDFGISHLARPAEGQPVMKTKTGTILGTPRYMSPEQAKGEKTIDERADLYSVGVILYEMLTRRLPFEAKRISELIAKLTTRDPTPPRTYNPQISSEFEDIILRAIAKDPAERFSNASEFAAYLTIFKKSDMESEEMPSVVANLPIEVWEKIRGDLVTQAPVASGSSPSEGMLHASNNIIRRLSSSYQPLMAQKSPSSPSTRLEEIAMSSTLPVTPPPGPVAPERTPIAGDAERKENKTFNRIAVVAAISLAVIAAAGAFMYYKTAGTKKAHEQALQAQEIHPASDTRKLHPGVTKKWKVTLAGIPKNAAVYVDDVLHPEHPVVLQDKPDPRNFTIEAPGFRIWKKSVTVRADMTLPVEMAPADSPEKE